MPPPSPAPSLDVPVTTTLPVMLPNTDREHIHTARLVLRPLRQSDLALLHHLRSQPEVMRWTALGIVDNSPEVTQQKLDPFLPPNDLRTYNFAICLRKEDDREHQTVTVDGVTGHEDEGDKSGEFIGVGGCHRLGLPEEGSQTLLGWPEIGYMIRKEFWGKGYASEFLEAFMAAWRVLPRQKAERMVDRSTVFPVRHGEGGAESKDGDPARVEAGERLVAITEHTNFVSIRLLEKNGFIRAKEWKDKNMHPGAAEDVTLDGWVWDPAAPPYTET